MAEAKRHDRKIAVPHLIKILVENEVAFVATLFSVEIAILFVND